MYVYMKSRRRGLKRGGHMFSKYTQNLRFPSFRFRKQTPSTSAHAPAHAPAHKPASPNRHNCREHDPDDKSTDLPPWYKESVFYFTGNALRVFTPNALKAYYIVNNYTKRNATRIKEVVYNITIEGNIYTFVYHSNDGAIFYRCKISEVVEERDYFVVDITKMITHRSIELPHKDQPIINLDHHGNVIHNVYQATFDENEYGGY